MAAEGCGINVASLKLAAFVIGAFWAGMAGNIFAAKMTIISPGSFSFWESVIVFVVVILSGGSHTGVLIGAFLIVALPELFRDFADARMFIFGLTMMIMMIVRPQGLLPPQVRTYDHLLEKQQNNTAGGQTAAGSGSGQNNASAGGAA